MLGGQAQQFFKRPIEPSQISKNELQQEYECNPVTTVPKLQLQRVNSFRSEATSHVV